MLSRLLVAALSFGIAASLSACAGQVADGEENTAAALSTSLVVHAENYAAGGEGVGYHDTTPGNTGGALRTDGVDIQAATGGGYNVGWIAAGEWLAYTVTVPTAGSYGVDFQVASARTTAKSFHLVLDGVTQPSTSFAASDGWQTWHTVTGPAVQLGAGTHQVRFVAETDGFNLARFTFTSACGLSAKLVDSCGVLWGFYAHNNASELLGDERDFSRRMDIVKSYQDFSDWGGSGVFPTSEQTTLMQGGRIWHYAWETRVYGTRSSGMPTPAGSANGTNNVYTYQQILNGSLDAYLDRVAARIKANGKPMFINFDHEPDDSTRLPNGSNAYRGAAGSPEEFKNAYRYLIARFQRDGVTNVVWVMAFAGFQGDSSIYARLYAGDDVIDWIGYDPYNHVASAWKTPQQTFQGFYDRLDGNLLGATAAAKPRMLPEFGSIPDARRPAWMLQIPSALKALPKLRAVEYFNSSAWGQFTGDANTISAFGQAGLDPYVHVLP